MARTLPVAGSAASRVTRLTWWAAAAAVALLVVHKPWALTTPQLWAEDGSVQLTENDMYGARAILMPDRGYLPLLPRLVAWGSSHIADVAHWPALYNGAALFVAAAIFARMASARLDLPGKPWLVLALVLAAHTGEVFLILVNLQWMTAFFLLQQVLIDPPTTPAQRLGDYAVVLVIGLTGPFVLVFFPLFVWRWWRDRRADNVALLLLVAACAAVQAYFVKTSGIHLEPQSHSINFERLLAAASSRLVIWPLLGAQAARALPGPAAAAIGGTFVALLACWTLRPHPRRLLRAQILAAFALITTASVYRIHPDTWAYPDLANGDSYFYIPRILLAWLLIWEFDAVEGLARWAARVLCIGGILANLPGFVEAAPTDYHWAEHCDPIRRGVPAVIPTLPEGWMMHYNGRPTPS